MKKDFICIVCPRGCHIHVDGDNITGYTCQRGLAYVKQELVDPKRTITSTIKVNGGDLKVVPCKTESNVSKELIFKIMEEINKTSVDAPVAMHQVLIENVLGTGVNVIAAKEVKKI
jgi:CxxC motif-containing protein